MEYTVNQLLTMQRHLSGRRAQLQSLAQENSRRFSWRDSDKEEHPVYDVKELDAKVTKINNALFKIDCAVKASNAKTNVDIDIDFDVLGEAIS